MTDNTATPSKLPIVVLISGNGSNLQAIIDASQQNLAVTIEAVISNRAEAYGLTRAANAGIPTIVLDHTQFESREAYDEALQREIDAFKPKLVVLAGFMRILTDRFVSHYEGRLINIHPSLLPKFRGLNTHQRALDAGEQEHGATVHFVTPELDGGPAVLQARVPVLAGDDAETVAQRVLQMEHQVYPLVIRWIAESRLRYRNQQVSLDGQLLTEPLLYTPELTD
ncbi:MAG: phosphoribosylglycinamide formyltransferase [Gammaproteobacteria bacterium]|jgi:phosphoribosylglycinamide formyltransferase-1